MIHYMDDIVVGSENVTEMLQKLLQVFDAMSELDLTVNIRQCVFMKQTIDFLGHQIHPAGISPGKVKTCAIREFVTPTTVSEVRQFLGLSGYFRKFT